jgi:RimJ/RimL family protein N-acetyltransferase
MYNLKKITKNDIKLLFDWANDPDVRTNATNPKPITWKEHTVWFTNKLINPNSYIYILNNQILFSI